MIAPTITLADGYEMPLIGLGTWELKGRECTQVVKMALNMGYRHIDTAHIYENHKAIAKALKDVDRDEIFLVSKCSIDQVEASKEEHSVQKALSLALKELQVEYLDLYLIHWPDRTKRMDLMVKTMHHLRKEGRIRSVGVSNFTIHHLQDLIDAGIQVSVNQVEFHPYLYQKDLLDFCKKHKIQLVAYRPLGFGAICKDPLVKEIGKTHNKSPAQILLRWQVEQGIVAIPKASSKAHLAANIEVFDFKLSSKEMENLSKLNRNLRYCDAESSEFNY